MVKMAGVSFSDIEDAFHFVGSATYGTHQAIGDHPPFCIITGRTRIREEKEVADDCLIPFVFSLVA
jgi:hypothetical protein